MLFNPDKYHPFGHAQGRRSIRLKGYDYSQIGWYFITICTYQRQMFFGDVLDGGMVLNDYGKIVETIWMEIPKFYSGIGIDIFQIMPNHFHGIINIVGTDPRVCPDYKHNKESGQSQGIAPTGMSLGDVIKRFKSLTTKKYIDGVNHYGWKTFNDKIWQRNYYEHIIRDEDELNRIRTYIINNPGNWEDDRYFK